MRPSAAERALDRTLAGRLTDVGFSSRGPLDFARPTATGTDFLRFHCRRVRDFGLRVAGTAGILVASVNELLQLDDATPTVVVPFHLLREDRRYFDWPLEDEDAADDVAAEILEVVERNVLPFFERHRQPEAIKRALESPNPRDWFVLSPEQRIVTLAALEHSLGSTKRAVQLLDQALAERHEALQKDRRPIELVRERLARSA